MEKVPSTEKEWLNKLGSKAYRVMREKGTEPPFSGEYAECKEAGVYRCRGCGQELFLSEDKFDSGSGWPSYTKPTSTEAVIEETDTSHGMVRTEVVCSRCHSHLGHVFPDGPAPTGMRYCINSVALDMVKE